MDRVIQPSRKELVERRRRLLDRTGSSYEELAARARRHDLEGDEWWLWEEICSVDFLLGADAADSHGGRA